MPLRAATAADVPGILALLRQAPAAAQWSEAQIRHLVEGVRPDTLCLVVDQGETVPAFLAARAVGSEWELENMAVALDARRHGLGSQLLSGLLERARLVKGTSVSLEARDSNRAARCLYEKLGFVVSGRRPHYYRNPAEDAVLYRIDLGESAS